MTLKNDGPSTNPFEPTNVSSKQEKKWRVKFEELKLYKKIHGHCMVSMLDKENRSLATWVSNQRTQYRNRLENKKASINQQRIELLNEMCFQWNVHARSKKNERNKENISSSTNEIAQSAWAKGKNKMNWMKMFDRLCEYKKIYGNTNVQKKHDGKLKNWVANQRQSYKYLMDGKSFVMTAEKILLLEGIGFIFENCNHREPENLSWNMMFERLRQFKSKYGDCIVPPKYVNDPQLAYWVSGQRTNYKSFKSGSTHTLTEELIIKLDSLGFIWETSIDSDAYWKGMFARLQKYRAKHGHCLVPARYENDSQLARFVITQRKNCQTLSDEKLALLERVGFVWDVGAKGSRQHEVWLSMLARLKEYRQVFGHCNVPYNCYNEPKLYEWMCIQRKGYWQLRNGENSPLTCERIILLEELSFPWKITHDTMENTNMKRKRMVETSGRSNTSTSMKRDKPMLLLTETTEYLEDRESKTELAHLRREDSISCHSRP